MAELRVYVNRTHPTRFRLVTLNSSGPERVPEFEMHFLISGTCTAGFWCPRCHPQIDLAKLGMRRGQYDMIVGQVR